MNNYIDIENKDKSITKAFIMGMKHSKKYGYDFLVCIVKTKVVMYAIKKVNDNFYKYDINNLVVISNLNNEFQDARLLHMQYEKRRTLTGIHNSKYTCFNCNLSVLPYCVTFYCSRISGWCLFGKNVCRFNNFETKKSAAFAVP